MSDCSAKAMTPKEPPKTCGTCGHSCGHETQLYGCVYHYVPCLLHGTFEHEEDSCSDWKSRAGVPARRNGKALEQRCQRLEQLARDMYAALHVNEHCSLEFIADNGDCETFRARLEALGVSLDG